MKIKKFAGLFALSAALVLTVSLAGCTSGGANRDIMEEPEITVEYLSGEYADQIIRDGGEDTLGTISIEQGEEGTYHLTVNSMVIVESSITDEGYYIADKNISTTVPLASDARVTYIKDKKSGPQVVELDKFIEMVQKDSQTEPEPGEEHLYEVYIIGGDALMILAKELPGA